MPSTGYNSGIVTLTEGEWFPFTIHNILLLQDNEWYYVLQDINGLKHFMPSGYYAGYGYSKGDVITCKIDRVNCTGRIFLEPRHPLYISGEIYPFDLKAFVTRNSVNYVVLIDNLGNNIEVPLGDRSENDLNFSKKVWCLVKNIRKGRPILEFDTDGSYNNLT